MLPILNAALSRPPAGRGRPVMPSAPPDVGAILVTSTEASWSGYAEPAGFEGYVLRTTATAGTAWERATVFGGLTTASTVALPALPATAVEILVKAVANGLESINAARELLPGVVAPPPPGDDWKIPNHLVANKTPVDVGSKAAFDAAKGALNPATHYVRLTGRMAGFEIDKGGSEAHPLVVTCDMPPAEKDWLNFAGRNGFDDGACVVTARWVWVFGVKARRTDELDDRPAIQVKADDVFLTCNQIDAPKGIANIASDSPGHRYTIAFNEFTGICNPQTANDLNEGQVFLQCGAKGNKQPDFGRVHSNIYRQSAEPGGKETHCFYTGSGIKNPDGSRDEPYDINLPNTEFRRNYLVTRRGRAAYMKHAARCFDNHIVAVEAWNSLAPRSSGGPAHMASYRGMNAIRGYIARNRIEGGEGISVQGWDAEIRDNVLTNGAKIELFVHCDNPDNPKTLLGANGAKVVNNRAPLVVGAARLDPGFEVVATDKLRDVTIEGHVGAVVDADGTAINWGPVEADGYQRPTRALPNCVTSTIRWKAAAPVPHVPPPSYTLDTCGPRAPGKTWGGGTTQPPPPDPLAIGASYAVNYAHKTGGSGGGPAGPHLAIDRHGLREAGARWNSGGHFFTVSSATAYQNKIDRRIDLNNIFQGDAISDTWANLCGNARTKDLPAFATAQIRTVFSWMGIPDSHHALNRLNVYDEIAAGDYDAHYQTFANNLHAAINGTWLQNRLILRLSWEQNGLDYPMTMVYTDGNGGNSSLDRSAKWKAAFRHIVDIVRGKNPGIGIMFCPLRQGRTPVSIKSYFPGRAYVDYMGFDFYHQEPIADWAEFSADFGDTYQGGPAGQETWFTWAKEVGCQFIVGEWGCNAADKAGDSPAIPEGWARWFNSIRGQSYPDGRPCLAGEMYHTIGVTDIENFPDARKKFALYFCGPNQTLATGIGTRGSWWNDTITPVTVPFPGGAPGGAITQPAAGRIRMAGGVADVDAPATLLTIGRLFNRGLLAKPFEVEAKVTRKLVPATTTTHGGFVHVGLAMPTNAAPARAPADWPAGMDMRDEEVAKILKGWRATMANVNTTGSAESDRLRLRTYNGTDTNSRTVVDPDTDQIVDFGLNVARTVRVRFAGSSVRVEVVELSRVATFTHADLGGFSEGYLMFTVSYDMDAEIADVRRLS